MPNQIKYFVCLHFVNLTKCFLEVILWLIILNILCSVITGFSCCDILLEFCLRKAFSLIVDIRKQMKKTKTTKDDYFTEKYILDF